MVIVLESKQDEQNLIDAVGDELANQFLQQRKKFKSPYNDIYYWVKRTPEELDQFLNSYQSKSDKVKADKSGADLIYSDENWKVYHIKTYEASVYYGKNTQWCISGSKRWSNGERGEEYFNDYHGRGIEFYFYINSKNEKYALALYPNGKYEIFNQVDNAIKGIPDAPKIDGLPDMSLSEIKINNNILIQYNGDNSEFVIPNNVIEIGNSAFYECSGLVSVKIPNSVKTIGRHAFANCTSLTDVKIPNSVTKINKCAFKNCTSLTDIAIPDSVTEITSGMFMDCINLKNIKLPNSVTKICTLAFCDCTSLTDITIPNSVIRIGDDAFSGCESITDITIPNSVKVIEDNIFIGCSQHINITILNDNCQFWSYAFNWCDDITVHCNRGSSAEQYCIDNDIEYDYNI